MTNAKTITVLFASMTVLLGAAMIANPIALVNAQGNQSQGNQSQGNKSSTTGAKTVTITKIDVDPLTKAIKDAYPKAGDIKDDKVDAVKDLKDAKEAAKTLVAANLLRDLMQFKSLQDMQ